MASRRRRAEAPEAPVGAGTRYQDPDRKFDTSQLCAGAQGRTVHRDYAAHYFRWGFASNFVGPDVRVLDIGCGRETPMVYVLGRSAGTRPEAYVGMDAGKVKKPNVAWIEAIYDEADFTSRKTLEFLQKKHKPFDVITCFEVIEHMPVASGLKLLQNARELLADGECRFILSTPVFNGKAAKNHIHEYEREELRELIEKAGLAVVKEHGTFASWNDLKKVMTKQERALMEELHQWHSHEVLSTFLAPKYPEASRNICWVLRTAR